jgi:hypothetical protein
VQGKVKRLGPQHNMPERKKTSDTAIGPRGNQPLEGVKKGKK